MKPTLQKAAPHIRRGLSSRDVMLDVLIACLPMSIGGVWNFGWRALWVILVSVVTCGLCDEIGNRLRGQRVFDGSGLVTGVLLALCLPAGVPFWALILSSRYPAGWAGTFSTRPWPGGRS